METLDVKGEAHHRRGHAKRMDGMDGLASSPSYSKDQLVGPDIEIIDPWTQPQLYRPQRKAFEPRRNHIDVSSDLANSTTSLGETPGYIPHKPQTNKIKQRENPLTPTGTPHHAKHATEKN
jgi:hypothetical protein